MIYINSLKLQIFQPRGVSPRDRKEKPLIGDLHYVEESVYDGDDDGVDDGDDVDGGDHDDYYVEESDKSN